ncbi:MAG: TetR/AcrR family transcriptional regulator [Moraxellaceae bacterium]|nr:TetR/AcrR family transcriptional regulator [Moraxellaceae bacterium]
MIELDKIDDLLVNSELAKQLVPNKFKFTSQQGRIRRQKLLMGARELSKTRLISEISLADICQEADIPRASAYHFFPNVDSIFLALRFLNAIELLEGIKEVDISNYDRWQGYLTAVVDKAVKLLNDDPTKAKLVYEANAPDFEGKDYGTKVEYQVSKIFYDNLDVQYHIIDYDRIKNITLIGYSIVNAIFTISYRQHGCITDYYRQEAVTACIAYLRSYLPETLNRK